MQILRQLLAEHNHVFRTSQLRLKIAKAATRVFVPLTPPPADTRVAIDLMKWDPRQMRDVDASLYMALLDLLACVSFKAMHFNFGVASSLHPTTFSDIDQAVHKTAVDSHLFSNLSHALEEKTAEERRSRVFKVLANWTYGLPINAKSNLPDELYRQAETTLETAEAGKEELKFAATFLSNVAYNFQELQNQLIARGVPELVYYRIMDHKVLTADDHSRINMRGTALTLLFAFLNCQYEALREDMPADRVCKLVEHLAKLCNAGSDENVYLMRLGYIVACLLALTAEHGLVTVLKTAETHVLSKLAQAGREQLHLPAAVRNDIQGLWPMSYLFREADRVAAEFFAATAVLDGTKAYWTAAYWTGSDDSKPLGSEEAELLDGLCLLGVAPKTALEIVRTKSDCLQAVGLFEFVVARFKDNLLVDSFDSGVSEGKAKKMQKKMKKKQAAAAAQKTKEAAATGHGDGEGDGDDDMEALPSAKWRSTRPWSTPGLVPDGIGYALWHSYDCWRKCAQEQSVVVDEDMVETWLASYLAEVPLLRQTLAGEGVESVYNETLQLGNNSSAFYSPATGGPAGQEPVLFINVPLDVSCWSLPKLAEHLTGAGLDSPRAGAKRWFHACYGDRVVQLLDEGIIRAATTRKHDLSRMPVLYMHEFYKLAERHAPGVSAGFEAPRGLFSIIVFDILDETLLKRPHRIPQTLEEARCLIFAAHSKDGLSGLLQTEKKISEIHQRNVERRTRKASRNLLEQKASINNSIEANLRAFGQTDSTLVGGDLASLTRMLYKITDEYSQGVAKLDWLFAPMFTSHDWSVNAIKLKTLSARELDGWMSEQVEATDDEDDEAGAEAEHVPAAALAGAADAAEKGAAAEPGQSPAQRLGLVCDPMTMWTINKLAKLRQDQGEDPDFLVGQLAVHAATATGSLVQSCVKAVLFF